MTDRLLSDVGRAARHREDLDDTLVVEAAAGTGKTTELVNRILRVLATGRATMMQIVAVTFTEKAAGELKLRLREALEQERADADAADVRERLEHALETLEEAHVNTIHGFCAELLRERPVEARVDPLFAVLTEPQADRLYDARVSRLAAGGAAGSAGRLSPRACADQRSRRFAAATAEGPIDRLRGAGRRLAEWRDFPAPLASPAVRPRRRDRPARRGTARLADLTSTASSTRDNLYIDTDARAAAQPPDPARAVVRPARSRRLGSAPGRPDARPRVLAHAERQLGYKFGKDVTRTSAGRARRVLQRASAVREDAECRPGGRAPAGAGRRDGKLSDLEGSGRRARFRRPAGARARLADLGSVGPSRICSASSRAFSSTSSRTPIRFRRKSCCCSRQTMPTWWT